MIQTLFGSVEQEPTLLEKLKSGLPPGVEILPTYDRSSLIKRAIDNLGQKLVEEFIVVALVPAAMDVKLACPSTMSALAPLLVGMALKIRMRLLAESATAKRTPSEDTLVGKFIWFCAVPVIWQGCAVPEVLVSGDHQRIRDWRRAEAERLTRERRPDLWRRYVAKEAAARQGGER